MHHASSAEKNTSAPPTPMAIMAPSMAIIIIMASSTSMAIMGASSLAIMASIMAICNGCAVIDYGAMPL